MDDSGITAIQHFGKAGLHQVVIDFPGDSDEPDHEVGSNREGEEAHDVICRIIGRRYGFPFELVDININSEKKNGKVVFICCVVIDFKGRRLAGRAKERDLQYTFTKACEDAALRIPKLLEHSQEMLLAEEQQVRVPEEERYRAFALP